jgi:hypothetical protein
MGIIWWTDEQRELLKQIYPNGSKKELLKAFKPKTWYAIYKEALSLGLTRKPPNMGRPKKKPRQVLGKNELTELLRKDLTIDQIAKKLRTEPHIVRRFIQKYGL